SLCDFAVQAFKNGAWSRRQPRANACRPSTGPGASLICQAEDKCQSSSEPSHVSVAEMSDLPPDPFAPHSDRLVGHHLQFEPQSIFRFRLDSDSKIQSVSQLGSQLTDHHRGMV